MAGNLSNEKKQVATDWQHAFPGLTQFAPNKFYKILGPMIIGIELIYIRWSDNYRPHFVAYSLWEKDLKTCLMVPFLLNEFYNKRNFQFDIPYVNHNVYFREAVLAVKQQILIPFDCDISFDRVYKVVDYYSKNSFLKAAPNSYLSAHLQKQKMLIGLYNSLNDAMRIFKTMNERQWDVKHFNLCKVELSDWFKSLQETISNREEFLNQIAINKQDRKIQKLKSSDLIN